MSLLPSRGPDASASQDGELEIVGVDEDVSAVLDALGSETARDILNAVYEEPGTPSELADRLDMSIQKVSYHLEKLESEELIAVAGTQYSEKGQEMKVYEPPEDPLVLFVGTRDRKRSLRSLAERLLPAVGLLTAASAVVQLLFGTVPDLFGTSGAGGGAESQADSAPPETATPEPTPEATGTEGGGFQIAEATDQATEAPQPTEAPAMTEAVGRGADAVTTAAGGGVDLEPGVAFFLGGLLVLGVLGLTWAYTR